MAGCTSKVLCVLALLFVSAYADVADPLKGPKTEDEETFYEEIGDADLNTDGKYVRGNPRGTKAWRNKRSSAWKNYNDQAWKRNQWRQNRDKASKKNKRSAGKKNQDSTWNHQDQVWKNEFKDNFEADFAYPKPYEPAQSVQPGSFNGKWELISNNSGVSAMHAILLPKVDKVLMYDATIWKVSEIQLTQEQRPCRPVENGTKEVDCFAHSVLFDFNAGIPKPLKIHTDTWCSSGGLSPDGNLVSTGGNKLGSNTVRYLTSCDTCDWREYPSALADGRWYGTQVTLADGGFIVAGGRGVYSYEFIPAEGQSNKKAAFFPFLKETKDIIPGTKTRGDYELENNLYPFLHLAPDGNVFFFANNRSVLLNPRTNQVVREFPALPGGPRNYPASGVSALLPIKLDAANPKAIKVEVIVCGGAFYDAYFQVDFLKKKPDIPALKDCGRMEITSANPVWTKEDMPTPRVMGDIMILPNTDLLLTNGAKRGSSGWNDASDPNYVPVLYSPNAPLGQRFKELAASTIPRMYHSTSTVLPDGKILIAGSNTNDGYKYKPAAEYPTELRVEKFSPPYLDPSLDGLRQEIIFESSEKVTKYNAKFTLKVKSKELFLNKDDLLVTMYAPAFTTHGVNMNQRQLVLGISEVSKDFLPGVYNIVAVAPPSGELAPPGYYLISVVYKGVPSKVSMWLQLK